MTNRFIPSKPIQNASVKRPVSMRVFVWLAIFAITGALISCGFVISARQQFEAISLGYRGEELRQEEARLQEKLRNLQLKRDIITSPKEMEQRALKLGLVRPLSTKKPDPKKPQPGTPEIRRPVN
jgi:hypothetical protein